MTRIACLLILIAAAILVNLALRMTGKAAIWFSFVGMPALVAGVLIYSFKRWREGAFHGEKDRRGALH